MNVYYCSFPAIVIVAAQAFKVQKYKFGINNKKFNSILFYKYMEYRVTKISFGTRIQICYKRLNTSMKARRSFLPFALHPYYQRDRINNDIAKYSIMAFSASYAISHVTLFHLHINSFKTPMIKCYFILFFKQVPCSPWIPTWSLNSGL